MSALRALLSCPALLIALAGCPDAIPGTPGDGGATSQGGGGNTPNTDGAGGTGATGGTGGDGGSVEPAFDGAMLTPPGDEGMAFGHALAIEDGDPPTLVVGAPDEWASGSHSGAAYVYVANEGAWTLQQRLVPQDGSEGDNFGHSVAIAGDTAFIAAPDDNAWAGAVYVFVRVNGNWVEDDKITVVDSRSFGSSIAFDDGTLLIGEHGDNTNGSWSGAAHVYVHDGSQWMSQAKIVPSDGTHGDRFGVEVALDGDTAVMGAPEDDAAAGNGGSAYVYVRAGSTWTFQEKLLAADADNDDQLGYALAIDGDTIVMGADNDDVNGPTSGTAYVFVREGDTWSQQTKLIAPDGVKWDNAGRGVSVLGDRALMGAPGVDGVLDINVGAAYVFERNADDQWLFAGKLMPETPVEEQFGTAIAMHGGYVVIGAPEFGHADHGKAYVWRPE